MEKDLIYFGVDHNDVAFCYIYLTKYNREVRARNHVSSGF